MLKKELKKILPDDIYLLDIVEDSLTDCLKITIDSVAGVNIKTTTGIAKIIKNHRALIETELYVIRVIKDSKPNKLNIINGMQIQ